MPHDFDAIIFDMDGTLVDSEIVWEEAEAAMFAARNLAYTDEVRHKVIGLRLDEFWQTLIDHYGLTETVPALTEELVARMEALIPIKVQPKPGAQALIDYVAGLGLPYCIASSSPLRIIEAIVQSQGWADVIPQRYSADAVALGKPAPDVYLYAAQQLGADPARCLALEDSLNGARSAVAAGMMTFVIPDQAPANAFTGITPHIVPSLHDVLAYLKS